MRDYTSATAKARTPANGSRGYLGDGDYRVETIAQADDKTDANGVDILTFKDAQARARKLYDDHQRASKAEQAAEAEPKPEKPYTVADAIAAYLAFLAKKPKGSVRDARWRAEALILPQLGDIPLAALKKKPLQDWLDSTAQLHRGCEPDKAKSKNFALSILMTRMLGGGARQAQSAFGRR